jgi:type IX secretion system PorP/SprF family membrane protein
MRIIYTLCGLLLVISQAWGQQRPQFSQYMMNNYLLNPAITGIEDYTDVKLGVRQQWVGLEGAPKTYYISAHTPLNKLARQVRNVGPGKGLGSTRTINRNRFAKPTPHHGVGVLALTDQTGPLRRSNFYLTYAYHLPVSRAVTVALGANAGLLRFSFNPSQATYNNPADPVITGDYINRSYFDFGLGAWIYSERFFLGLSGAQLLRSDRDLNIREDGNNNVMQNHFHATAGYKVRLNPDVALVPSVMVKLAEPSPVSVDVNLQAIFVDRVWVGASYRNEDALVAMAGVNISYIMDASYAYDYNSSGLNTTNKGTHEIVLGLKLFNKAKVICPRWMH